MHDQRGDATMPTEPTDLASWRTNRAEEYLAMSDEKLFDLAEDDDFALEVLRERRFERRAAYIAANTTMDADLKAQLLDRTLLNSAQQKEQTGFNQPRLTHLRNDRTSDGPHPSVYPDRDKRIKVNGRIDQAVEGGRLLEWELQSGRKVWDGQAKRAVKPANPSRHGRPAGAKAAKPAPRHYPGQMSAA